MRRGLMAWDAEEIPVEALRERTRRLQAEMAKAGQDAIILYTNFIRSAAVSYLTAFSPYWADGVLLVPREGEPLFATTLSKRVGEWIQTVKPVGELATSPTPGTVIGQRIAAANLRRIAILELGAFPSGLYNEIAAAAPQTEIVDGTNVFAKARIIDEVERNLLERADKIAATALNGLDAEVDKAGDAVGAIERSIRLQGAEEAYVAIACDLNSNGSFARVSGPAPLGRRFAVRATVAYKGVWTRRIRTYSREVKDLDAIAKTDQWFARTLSKLNGQRSLQGQVENALLPGAKLKVWSSEGPFGTRPLAEIAWIGKDGRAASPAPVVTVSLDLNGLPWYGAGLAQRRA